jgi:outer membrane protein OmpA-like peptidoglycan-associated protein
MRNKTYLALGCLLLAGCTTQADGTQSVNKTAVGATVGAVAGGVLGNRLDKGNRTRGTIIGAAAGAAAGGGLGYMMDRQEKELREQLASERAQHAIEIERVRDDLLKLTLANEISFDVDSTTVKPAFRPSLAKVADVLKSYDTQVTIVGHTDSTGAASYNQQLSERRAQAVLDELVRLGVPYPRLSAMGRGEDEPRADTRPTPGGRRTAGSRSWFRAPHSRRRGGRRPGAPPRPIPAGAGVRQISGRRLGQPTLSLPRN